MQAFYVKKEKKLSNVYHKIKAENQASIDRKLKESETKFFYTQILNYFLKNTFIELSQSIKIKDLTLRNKYFFCKTLDIFLKHDKIKVVGRIKSLSNKNKILYKEIFANEQSGNCKKSHRCLGRT